MMVVVVTLAIAGAFVWVIVRQAGATDRGFPFWNSWIGEVFATRRDRLRRLCHEDEALARRLIDHEKERAPGISEREAVTRALARLERDVR